MDQSVNHEEFFKTLNQRGGWRGMGSHILLLIIFIVILSAFIWAGYSELDRVTRADGRVVPSRQVQTISNLEGGIIKEVLV
ncbi:MAG: hypothetical protein HQL67_12805, partial [Magnetococcales bacterium]|nr:hypothetical protein [Magnetococcales bacterium]